MIQKTVAFFIPVLAALVSAVSGFAQSENDVDQPPSIEKAEQWLKQMKTKYSKCDGISVVYTDYRRGKYWSWSVLNRELGQEYADKRYPEGRPEVFCRRWASCKMGCCKAFFEQIAFSQQKPLGDENGHFRFLRINPGDLIEISFYKAGKKIGSIWVSNELDFITDNFEDYIYDLSPESSQKINQFVGRLEPVSKYQTSDSRPVDLSHVPLQLMCLSIVLMGLVNLRRKSKEDSAA